MTHSFFQLECLYHLPFNVTVDTVGFKAAILIYVPISFYFCPLWGWVFLMILFYWLICVQIKLYPLMYIVKILQQYILPCLPPPGFFAFVVIYFVSIYVINATVCYWYFCPKYFDISQVNNSIFLWFVHIYLPFLPFFMFWISIHIFIWLSFLFLNNFNVS